MSKEQQSSQQRQQHDDTCGSAKESRLTRKRVSAACERNARECKWRHNASVVSAPSAQRMFSLSNRLDTKVATASMMFREPS
jgi:hypothetical protein